MSYSINVQRCKTYNSRIAMISELEKSIRWCKWETSLYISDARFVYAINSCELCVCVCLFYTQMKKYGAIIVKLYSPSAVSTSKCDYKYMRRWQWIWMKIKIKSRMQNTCFPFATMIAIILIIGTFLCIRNRFAFINRREQAEYRVTVTVVGWVQLKT